MALATQVEKKKSKKQLQIKLNPLKLHNNTKEKTTTFLPVWDFLCFPKGADHGNFQYFLEDLK